MFFFLLRKNRNTVKQSPNLVLKVFMVEDLHVIDLVLGDSSVKSHQKRPFLILFFKN